MKTYFISLLLLLMTSTSLVGQNIGFDYDADGNLQSRHVTTLKSSVQNTEEETTDIVTIEFSDRKITVYNVLGQEKSYELSQPETTSKSYIARDYIRLKSGFSFNSTGNKTFQASINEHLLLSANYQTLAQIPNPNRNLNQSYAVGATAGEANVGPTGAAIYQIPIDVMPGTGGVQPNVSITYNSQSGNGLIGYGWSLNAVSAIVRVGKTLYHDGSVAEPKLDASDNLMMDGQRLMKALGTNLATSSTYKTEIESFLVITCKSFGSYIGFEVKNKEGWTLEYGSTADSYIKPKGGATAYAWLLKKATDANGNYMTYTYDNDAATGEFRLKQIDYTRNTAAILDPYNKVEFFYETRTDTSSAYIAGKSVKQSVILKRIKCSAYGFTIRDYKFNYYFDGIYSKLEEVEEYGQNGIRYNSTLVNWGDYDGAYSRYSNEYYASLSDNKVGTYPVYADFNGDGKTDFISYADKSSYSSSDVATLFLANILYGEVEFVKKCTIPLLSGFKKLYAGDFNGDGNMDVVREYTQNNKFYYTFFTFNGTQFVQGNTIETSSNKMVSIGDYNGDGKDEILFLSTGYLANIYDSNSNLIASQSFNMDPSTGNLCEMYFIDFLQNNKLDVNGNGKNEILCTQQYVCSNPPYSLCDPCTQASRVWTEIYELDTNNNFVKIIDQDSPTSIDNSLVGDFNGDGKSDLLFRYDDSQQNSFIDIYYSTGASLEKKTFSNLNMYSGYPIVSINDFNNDGKSDFAFFKSDYNQHYTVIYTSTGYDFMAESYPSNILVPSEVIQDTKKVGIGDFDGDGRNELIYAKWNNKCSIQAFNDKQNHHVKTIVNGLNQKVTFDYMPITNNSCYSVSTSAATFPVSKFQEALYVVKEMGYQAGSIGDTKSFKYKGAKVHRQGKGFLGFEEVTETNNAQNRKTTTQYGYNPTYFNTYPVKQTVTTISGDSISRTNFQYDKLTTSVSKVIYPYLKQQTTKDHLSEITKTVDYLYNATDDGNPYRITETQGSLVTQIVNTWEAKGGSAFKNRLTQQVITNSGIGASFSETKKFTYDTKARLTQKIDFFGHSKAVTANYVDYDSIGNPHTVTMTAANCPTITEISVFDKTGRFEETHTDALGKTSSARYDPKTGVLLEKTDIAGLKTSYQYDDFQRLIYEVSPIDIISYSQQWDISGNNLYKVTSNSQISGTQTTWYNPAGLETKSQSPGFSGTVVSEKEYNSKGQLYRSYLPGYSSKSTQYIEYGYDNYGRLKTENNIGRITSYGYSALTDTITTPDGKKTYSTRNLSGLLASSRDAAGNSVTYTYNSLGKPVTTTSNGLTTYINYDNRGFQRALKDANITDSIKYEYNAYGQLSKQINARKDTTSFVYDAAGRMTTQVRPENTLTYQYVPSGNGIGQIYTVKEGSQTVRTYAYTGLGQVSSVTENIDNTNYTSTYTYDTHGQLQEQQSPSGLRIKYQYTNGLLAVMRNAEDNTLLWQADVINALGQITESTLGNGLKRISGYDTYHLPNQILLKNGTSIIDQVNYTFNPVTGNLRQRNDVSNGKNEIFGYDNLNRLDSIQLNGGATNRMTYFANGNIQTKFDVGAYQYANGNQAVSSITNSLSAFSVHPISMTSTSYNRVSLLTKSDTHAKYLVFKYGPDNQRRKSEYYVDEPCQKIIYYIGNYEKEIIPGGSTKEYDYICTPEGLSAIAIKTNGTRSFFYVQTDHLGSVRVVTTAAKAIQTRYYYDAWGKQTVTAGTSITNRGYLAQEHLNEFGLINLNARLYDPVLARFMGMDPYVSMPDFTQSYNRYSYGLNNPLKYVDPDGEFPWLLAAFAFSKWYYDGWKQNGKEWNPINWDLKHADFAIGYSSSGGLWIGSGWNTGFMLSLGYSFSPNLMTMGYVLNGTPYMTQINQVYDHLSQQVESSLQSARSLYENSKGFLSDFSMEIPVYGASQRFGNALDAGNYWLAADQFLYGAAEMFTLGAGSEIMQGAKAVGRYANVAYSYVSRIAKGGLTNPQLVQKSATLAERAIGGTGRFAGTAKHTYANNLLNRYQSIYGSRGLMTNSYFNKATGKGFLDVVDHNAMIIYDYKFGNAVMGGAQYLKYSNSFPGYLIRIIRP